MTTLKILKVAAAAGAGIFWLLSAGVSLPTVGPGMEELDKVSTLAVQLRTAGVWNSWAATAACTAALIEIITVAWSWRQRRP